MLEQTKAQVQDLRLGITTQERTTKPAPVNLSTSGQLETVPESEYNFSETEPSAHDAVVGGRSPTQIPASNPRTSSATIPKSTPMPKNFPEVSTATRDSTRTPRPAHNLATPKAPSSTLDLDPDVIAPPRKPSVNQGLSDIRIYSAQRKDKGIRIIPKIEDIPGKHVIVYNPDTYECAVKEKHDINCKHQQAPLC